MESIMLPLVFAQDIWNIIHKAKHPHFESEIIEQVKNGLLMAIRNASVPEVPPQEEDNVSSV